MALQIRRLRNPDRTEVTDGPRRWMARFTDGATTVASRGPRRTFNEASAGHAVIHGVWVRTLPKPFAGVVDEAWLTATLQANAHRVPDVLAMAMQYIDGAAAVVDGALQIAGHAEYGALVDGMREEGADFNDYLGVPWTYADRVDPPETRQFRCLDCSGFVRMIWGYRHSLPGQPRRDRVPLTLTPTASRRAMPRRAFEIYASAPGIVTILDDGVRPTDLSPLEAGDLVFFDADDGDGTQLDHVGMFLGVDGGGHHRFISSRKGANGPTLGDYRGRSILDGTGLYARAFRGARRL
jgi:hypothetical protein